MKKSQSSTSSGTAIGTRSEVAPGMSVIRSGMSSKLATWAYRAASWSRRIS